MNKLYLVRTLPIFLVREPYIPYSRIPPLYRVAHIIIRGPLSTKTFD